MWPIGKLRIASISSSRSLDDTHVESREAFADALRDARHIAARSRRATDTTIGFLHVILEAQLRPSHCPRLAVPILAAVVNPDAGLLVTLPAINALLKVKDVMLGSEDCATNSLIENLADR